jgi:copper chaperone CopZ
MNIDFDLEDVDGVKTAKTNYAKQESEVVSDEEKVDIDTVIKIIKQTGYVAKQLEQ